MKPRLTSLLLWAGCLCASFQAYAQAPFKPVEALSNGFSDLTELSSNFTFDEIFDNVKLEKVVIEHTTSHLNFNKPVITVSETEPPLSNAASFIVTFEISEAVTDFVESDIFVANGNTSEFTGSGTSYSVKITPITNGVVTVNVPAGRVTGSGGDTNDASNQISVTSDTTKPEITISLGSGVSDPTNATSFDVKFTISEIVSTFTGDDITIGNGQLTNFSGSNQDYTATIEPDTDGNVTISVGADKVSDDAGNTNDPPTQLSIRFDQTKPTLAISTNANNPTNLSSFIVTFNFSEDVTGFTQDDLTVRNASLSAFSGSGDTYTATLEPNQDGADATIDLFSDKLTDLAGNSNDAATQFVIGFDQTKPTISLSTNESSPSNSGSFEVTFTASEVVTGFTFDDVTVTNGSISGFADTGDSKSFTGTITPQASGMATTIQVEADKLTDAAGNTNTASNTVSIDVDYIRPGITITSNESDPSNASTISLEIRFSEAVSGFNTDDIQVENGTISDFSSVSGDVYSVIITPSADGEIKVDIPANVATDAAGNNNTAAEQFSINSDQTKPNMSITSDEVNPSNSASFIVDFKVDEPVTGFTIDDIDAVNGALSDFTGSGDTYAVRVTPEADGSVTLRVGADKFTDAAGNTNAETDQFGRLSDQTPPVLTINPNTGSPTNANSVLVEFDFSESVANFAAEDITVSNANPDNFSGEQANYATTVEPIDDGSVTITVEAGMVSDAAGNPNEKVQVVFISDRTRPAVSLSPAQDEPVDGAYLVDVIFDEPIMGFDLNDIDNSDGQKSDFSEISSTRYTFKVTADVAASNVWILADKVQDAAGNGNLASNTLTLIFNKPPSDIELDGTQVNENNDTETAIGTFVTRDVDGSDTHTYALVDGSGNDGNSFFRINDGQLFANISFDFETRNSYSIRVSSTDNFGNSIEEVFIITVADRPEPLLRVTAPGTLPLTPLRVPTPFKIFIDNEGDAPATITRVTYTEGFEGPTQGFEVSAGGQRDLMARFKPTQAQPYSGMITVVSDGGTVSVVVEGEGAIITADDTPTVNTELVLKPNPADGTVTLDLAVFGNRPVNIQIGRTNGAAEYIKTGYSGKSIEIDTSSLSEGIYIVMVTDGEQQRRKKLMIIH